VGRLWFMVYGLWFFPSTVNCHPLTVNEILNEATINN